MPRDKSYKCIICGKRFVNSQILAIHFEDHETKIKH